MKLKYLLIISVTIFSTKLFSQSINNSIKFKDRFIVIAHRGDHTNAPENTLTAFQNAINDDADFVEIDLRTTKDSQLIVMHDASLLRMTGKNAYVRDMFFDSLHHERVRDLLHMNWGYHSIPSFEEVLNLCKNRINIYLDFKEASASQTYKMIKEVGMENNVLVYVNNTKQYTDWQSTAPEMPLMISLPSFLVNKDDFFDFLEDHPVAFLDGNYDNYNKEILVSAQEKHVIVWPDIQSPEESKNWKEAIQMGFRGLQTDHPKELILYLKKLGIR